MAPKPRSWELPSAPALAFEKTEKRKTHDKPIHGPQSPSTASTPPPSSSCLPQSELGPPPDLPLELEPQPDLPPEFGPPPDLPPGEGPESAAPEEEGARPLLPRRWRRGAGPGTEKAGPPEEERVREMGKGASPGYAAGSSGDGGTTRSREPAAPLPYPAGGRRARCATAGEVREGGTVAPPPEKCGREK
ncbi:uncharacterized protein [Miscanthus floridulus]|uniref:uncharacterized protein n=1 Tax=Miscanthus floridulus TaxID=154761 RepID=UPI00345A31E8